MPHRIDVLEQLHELMRAFPGQKLPESSLELYIDQLVDLPLWLLHQAVESHIQQSLWFPKIAELRRQAEKISNELDYADPEPPGCRKLQQDYYALKRAYYRDGVFQEAVWEQLYKKFKDIACTDSAECVRRAMQNIQREIELEQKAEEEAKHRDTGNPHA